MNLDELGKRLEKREELIDAVTQLFRATVKTDFRDFLDAVKITVKGRRCMVSVEFGNCCINGKVCTDGFAYGDFIENERMIQSLAKYHSVYEAIAMMGRIVQYGYTQRDQLFEDAGLGHDDGGLHS